MRRFYVYEVTWSAVETVKVGTITIDYETGPKSEWSEHRTWTLWNSKTHDFEDGWAGVKTGERICTICRLMNPAQFRVHKHDGPHGEGERFIPAKYRTQQAATS